MIKIGIDTKMGDRPAIYRTGGEGGKKRYERLDTEKR